MSTTIENHCIDCKSVAQPDCDARGHIVGTLGQRSNDECAFVHALPSGSVRCGALRQNHSQYTSHKFTEPDETDSLKSLSALLKDPSHMTLPRARQIAIKHAHWNATTLPNNEFSLSWQDTKVLLDANATLIEQRERLLRLLRPVTSPTACYCAVMKGEKCWHCEARELIATIEREGEAG